MSGGHLTVVLTVVFLIGVTVAAARHLDRIDREQHARQRALLDELRRHPHGR